MKALSILLLSLSLNIYGSDCATENSCYLKDMPLLSQGGPESQFKVAGLCAPTTYSMLMISALADSRSSINKNFCTYNSYLSTCRNFKNYVDARVAGKTGLSVTNLEMPAGKQNSAVNETIMDQARDLGFRSGTGTRISVTNYHITNTAGLFNAKVEYPQVGTEGYFHNAFQSRLPTMKVVTQTGNWKKQTNATGLTSVYYEATPWLHAMAVNGYDMSGGVEKVMIYNPWKVKRYYRIRRVSSGSQINYFQRQWDKDGNWMVFPVRGTPNTKELLYNKSRFKHIAPIKIKGKLVYRLIDTHPSFAKRKRADRIINLVSPNNNLVVIKRFGKLYVRRKKNSYYFAPIVNKIKALGGNPIFKLSRANYGSIHGKVAYVPSTVTIPGGSGTFYNNYNASTSNGDHINFGFAWRHHSALGLAKGGSGFYYFDPSRDK